MYYDAKKKLYREEITINGKRKAVSAKTKKECKLKLLALKEEDIGMPTLEQVASKWSAENMEGLKSGTARTYAPALRRAVEEFGKKQINTITPFMIKTYLTGLHMAYKTTSNYRTVLSLLFDYAITDMNCAIYNPCTSVKVPKSLPKSTRTTLTANEKTAILDTEADELQLAFVILHTGTRCGEALGLQMKDIDLNHNLIHISKQITHKGNQPVVSELKTEKSDRYIPLLPRLKARLLALDLKDDDYIVSGENPLTKSALDKRWKKWCAAHGVDIDRHTIRHEFATMLFEAGIDVKTAQAILGHSNFQTTMNIYTHVRDRQLEDAAGKLADYLA